MAVRFCISRVKSTTLALERKHYSSSLSQQTTAFLLCRVDVIRLTHGVDTVDTLDQTWQLAGRKSRLRTRRKIFRPKSFPENFPTKKFFRNFFSFETFTGKFLWSDHFPNICFGKKICPEKVSARLEPAYGPSELSGLV